MALLSGQIPPRRLAVELDLGFYLEDFRGEDWAWEPIAEALILAREDLTAPQLDLRIIARNSDRKDIPTLPATLTSVYGIEDSDRLIRLITELDMEGTLPL